MSPLRIGKEKIIKFKKKRKCPFKITEGSNLRVLVLRK